MGFCIVELVTAFHNDTNEHKIYKKIFAAPTEYGGLLCPADQTVSLCTTGWDIPVRHDISSV